MIRRRGRSAYTLVEIVLSLTIAILLLAALYSAVGFQLRQVQTGRDVTSQTTFNRHVIALIESDVAASLALPDAGRFRNAQKDAEAAQARQQSGGTTQQSGSTAQKSGTTTPTTGNTTTGASSGATTEAAGAAEAGETGEQGFNGPVVLPYGVVGDNTTLTLYVTKLPLESAGPRGDAGRIVSDVRRVTYWIAENGGGLCREEIKVATGQGVEPEIGPSGDLSANLIAPEVKSLEVRYFDGSSWVDSWDAREPGDDGITPRGAPRAIEIRLGILPPGSKDGGELKHYRHVIPISSANGLTQASTP